MSYFVRVFVRVSVLVLPVLLVGCAESNQPDAGSPGTDAGARTDAGGATDAGPDVDAGARSCGGFGGGTCESTEFCDYFDNICGAADGTGVCRTRPAGCPDVVAPVCGCDGTIHGNECEANAAGHDVMALAGSCTPQPGTFECGYRFCSTDSYCTVVIDDTGMPPSYFCDPLPPACAGAQDCACVAGEPCGSICMQDMGGNLQVTCPGG